MMIDNELVATDPNASQSADDEISQKDKRTSIWKRVVVALIFAGFISFVVADYLNNNYIKTGIDDFLQWVERNPTAGVFAFTGVYLIATVLFVPGSILTLGSGFVFANAFGLGWGVLLATVAVFVGASTGSVAAFLLGRYLLRDWVEATLSKKFPIFGAVDAALRNHGLRIMALLRLSPIIPFNALNYVAGITAVKLSHYVWALLAMLPGTVLYVFIGASAGSLADSSGSASNNRTVTIVTISVGVVFGILGVAATSYYAKKELNKAIEIKNGVEEEGNDYVSTVC